jgi:hypothetical protein
MISYDKIIRRLERRLKGIGCVTQSCEEYSIQGRDGEIDLYGFDFQKKRLFAIEVKQTDYHRNKAIKQLAKDEVYLRRLFFDFEPFSLHLF